MFQQNQSEKKKLFLNITYSWREVFFAWHGTNKIRFMRSSVTKYSFADAILTENR